MHLGPLLLLLALPLWITLVQAVATRLGLFPTGSPQRGTVTCSAVAAASTVLVVCRLEAYGTSDWQPVLFVVFVSLALGHITFHVFNMSETARRIRMLIDLKLGRDLDDCGETYSPTEIIQARIDRLLALDQIEEHSDRLFPRPTLLSVVARLVHWHELLIFPSRRAADTSCATAEEVPPDSRRRDSPT